MVLLVSLWLVNMVALVLSLLKRFLTTEGDIVWSYLIFIVAFNLIAVFLPTPGFERGLFVIDICIITCNTLAVALFVFYTNRVELYAGLPHTFPNLPSFGPEVICQPKYSKLFWKSTNLSNESFFAGCGNRTSGGRPQPSPGKSQRTRRIPWDWTRGEIFSKRYKDTINGNLSFIPNTARSGTLFHFLGSKRTFWNWRAWDTINRCCFKCNWG